MRKTRRSFVRPASVPSSDINVTPLVDVVLVLLIIFMVMTPLLEKEIDVRVPSTEKVEALKDVPDEQLVVRLDEAGELRINDEVVAADEYVPRLSKALEGKKTADKIVFVVADDEANYARLVGALDGARQAGAETLGMMTQVPEAVGTP